MPLPDVLLIHGVSSAGEWHDTTIRESRGIYNCVSIKYRYFHGYTGAIKVYVWPSAFALLLSIAVLGLAGSKRWSAMALLAILVASALIVVQAEYAWTVTRNQSWNSWLKGHAACLLPLIYPAAAAWMWLSGANGWLVIVLAGTAAVWVYLDLREYGHPYVSTYAALTLSTIAFGVIALGGKGLLQEPAGSALAWVCAGLVTAAIVEPWIRRALAFRSVSWQIAAARRRSPRPHVVAHSLGTYLLGHLLNESDSLALGRMILVGCVLDQSFPWHAFAGPTTRKACWAVKNYAAKGDFVPVMTAILRLIWLKLTFFARIGRIGGLTTWWGERFIRWRPLGGAGQWGFLNRDAIVHSQEHDILCPICDPMLPPAVVHNVGQRYSGHSEHN